MPLPTPGSGAVIIVDAHLDLAWNALQWDRDLSKSVHTTRVLERHLIGPGRGRGTVALPELRAGGVALCVATLLARSTGHAVPGLDYPSPAQAYAAAQGQLAYYRALERQGLARVVRDVATLDHHIAEWEAWDADRGTEDPGLGTEADPTRSSVLGPRPSLAPPPLGVVLGMESADPILEPDQLEEWREAGVRMIGPAHYGPGRYAGGTGTELGLSPPGVELLAGMQSLGIILDLTHLADRAFDEALVRYGGPVVASHANCRALVPAQRQLSDAQLRAVIERDGVVGAAFDAWMLQPGWIVGVTTNERVGLESVADQIDYVCQLAGDARHAGIGSDLDGGFGREQSPRDLDTVADVSGLGALLRERGYAHTDVAAIMYGNWLRVLRRAWAEDSGRRAVQLNAPTES